MDWETRIKALLDAIAPDVKALEDELAINHRWVQMTQAAYDALAVKDPNTLYVIVG